MRKAGDPGIVGQVVGFLEDNPLTRSWRDSVGGGINWMERQTMSEDDLRNAIAAGIKNKVVDNKIDADTLAALADLKGAAIDQARLEGLAAAHPTGVSDYIGGAAYTYLKGNPEMNRDRLKAELAAIQGPLNQRNEFFGGLATVATHPVAAYSAVTAGGALGTAGGMEAYDWWMAQQQQAEKEKQLPLS